FYGCQTIPQTQFDREREVVRQEIRQGGDAEGQILHLLLESIYPKGHAYERDTGGNDQQIASASLEDACEFIKKYYTPDRATVIVSGGVDVDQTVDLIQKWFAKLPKRAPSPRIEVKQFATNHQVKTFELDVDRPKVIVSWVLPPSNTPEGEEAAF